MRILILTALCAGLCTVATAQTRSHAIHLSANYLLTQQPLFGFGYHFQPDSTHLAFGMGFEFGRFKSEETGVLSTAVDRYEEAGIGFRPEIRYYLVRHHGSQRGFYVNGFANLRLFYSNHLEGRVDESGNAIEYPYTQSSMSRQWRFGSQLGFRQGCGDSGIMVEAALGGGYFTTKGDAYRQPGDSPFFLQLDLNLVGLFDASDRGDGDEDYFIPLH